MTTRVPITYGGTGANTAAGARQALDVLSTSGGTFTSNLNVNSVLTANGRGVFGTGFDAHAVDKDIDVGSIVVGGIKDSNGPAEFLLVNKSNGVLSYAEFIALNDKANQSQGWISVGINSSDYNDPTYTLTGPDDGYLLFEPPEGTTANGDLVIGTGSYGEENRIVLAAGGFEPKDAQLVIAPANLKSADIVNSSLNLNIAILTTSETHNFVANDVIVISSVGAPYDGTRTIIDVTSNTINVSITSANVASAVVDPPGEALEFLPFNKGTVELTAQLYVGEDSRSTIESADITVAQGHAIPLGIVVNNDGPGQTVMFNKSNGSLAYSEFIAHNDAGNVEMGWISIGINSSGYDDPEYPITKADDGYILYEPPAGTTGDGDLIIGTGTNGTKNRLIFAAEGFDEANAQMVITPNESVRIAIDTDASSVNTGALQVVGGVGVQGSMYVQGNQTIQGDLIVNGSQIIQSIENLAAAGPISLLSDGNIANTWDQGLVGTYAITKSSATSNVAFKELANNNATISTSNNHTFVIEDIVTVANVDATFDGTHRITGVTANTFTFYKLANTVTKTAATGDATVDKANRYTGVVKRASDGAWRVFSNLGTRPAFNTNFADANLVYDSIIAGAADFRGSLKLGTPNTATIVYTDANNRTLTIPTLSGDRTFAFLEQSQTFTAAQAFNSTLTATKFIPTAGDATGNGLYLPSANKLALSADGVERVSISASEMVVNDGSADYDFRVESDGVAHMLFVDGGTNTVGIGTNIPAQTLHVQGGGYFSGNVGIGITTPAVKLDLGVQGGVIIRHNPGTAVSSLSYSGFAHNDLLIGGIYASSYPHHQISFGHAGDPLRKFSIGSANDANFNASTIFVPALTVTSGGLIGIGTANPGYLLQVTNSANTAKVYVSGPTVTTAGIPGASIFIRDTTAASGVVGRAGIHFSSSPGTDYTIGKYWDGTNSWFTVIDNSANQLLTISSGGNVGIGTTNPATTLHVDASTGGIIRVSRVGSGAGILQMEADGTDGALSTTNVMRFQTSSVERMRIASNGFIGFGTTSPTNRFHVAATTDDGRISITNNDRGHAYANGFWIGVDSTQSYLLSRDNYPLTFFTNAAKRMTISGGGNIYTEAGSAISYGSGETYQIWNDEDEVGIVSSDANWKNMKTFVCSKSGNLKFKFSAFISSGTYYFGWRILQNGSTVLAVNSFAGGLDAGESQAVHAYRRFVVSIGPIAAGDSLVLQMASTGGDAVPVTGNGQTLYAKEFRAYSTVPNVEHGGSTNIWGGRVGIGTTNPIARLHVEGPATTASIGVENVLVLGRPLTSGASFQQSAIFKLGRYAAAGGIYEAYTRLDIALKDDTASTDYNTTTTIMTLLNNGRVGIGTTSPLSRLHVYGGDTVLYSGSGGNSPKLIFGGETSSTDKSIYLDTYWLTFKGHNNEGFKFITVNSSGTPTERFRVQGDGSTLLGAVTSTTADGLFTIKNYVAANINISLRDYNNQRRCIFIADGYYGYQWGQTIYADGGKAFSFGNAAGTEVGTIVVNNASTAYNTTSDYRLKENQAPLTGSGAFIDALQPKTWTWKSNGERGVGFIAHEVAAVSPASVTGEKDATRLDLVKDEDGNYVEQTIPSYQALEYGSPEFIANIIAELQSLRARVAALEQK